MADQEYDNMSMEERAAFDKKAKQREQEEQATLPYKWTQDLTSTSVTVPLPEGTRAKMLVVDIRTKRLKVQVKGSPEPILEGELFGEIKEEDSTWSIDDGVLSIELEKSARSTMSAWWPHVLSHHPKIDTTKITPENSKLSDLDSETRAMVEKMMFDNQQKQLGKPTSDEQKKLDMIEKFKNSHPEMDFSKAKIN